MLEPVATLKLPSGIELYDLSDILGESDINSSQMPEKTHEFLSIVFSLSPYLRACAERDPEFLASVLTDGFDQTSPELIALAEGLGLAVETEAELMQGLRMAKRRMALLCGLADLGGWWKDMQVTDALATFASACVSATLDYILLTQHNAGKLKLADPAAPQFGSGLVILGMGKHGAGELNYSSDIDLVIFYDDRVKIELLTDDPITLLNRMVKSLIKILQERTPDGYVFRTDLRLRPDPASTPLVIPVEAALTYYEGQGQNWERSAMIKAKPIAGDLHAGDAFLNDLKPFIWRKYLDFAAINDVHSIKRQIHAHKGHGEIAVYGHNVKLGRGGIREVEFFAQTQQLIAGGRNEGLRQRETIDTLYSLVSHGWLEKQYADDLTEAYWFLRAVEHRLQMIGDEQTHTLPDTPKEMAIIAGLLGEADVKRFVARVRSMLLCVEHHYANLFEASPELGSACGNLVFTGDDPDPDTVQSLKQMGYTRPLDIIKIIKTWHIARMPALRATQARELLTELVPLLLDTFSRTQNPDEVVFSFDQFVSGLPAGIQLFSILKNNPDLVGLLVRILDGAPKLTEQIARKPHVFDAMLEPGREAETIDRNSLGLILDTALRRTTSYEQLLDATRRFCAETKFQIGVRYFSGVQGYEKTAREYSMLADVIVGRIFEAVQSEFAFKHGNMSGAKVSILAMGRLGSQELTAASDLDLIFLYDAGDEDAESDGEKPLVVSQYFVRLMQRFITAMKAPMAEGILYDLDFRLRPSGNAGPLATQAQSFFAYQRKDAWVWEAQALTRARPIHGDPELCRRVTAEITDILSGVQTRHDVGPEILKMRALIETEKGSEDPWHVKSVRGGLLDLEFIAQWFALTQPEQVTDCIGTRQTLECLEAQGSSGLLKAYDLFSDVLHLGRIAVGESLNRNEIPEGLATVICNRLEAPSLQACEAELIETQAFVKKLFKQIIG